MPLNILHIIPNLRKGGAERLVIDIARELSKKEGIHVCLILFENKIEYDVEDIRRCIHIIPSAIQLSLTKKNRYTISAIQEFIGDFQPNIIHTHLFEAEIVSQSCFYPNAKWFSHCHDNMIQFKNWNLSVLFNKKHLTNYYEKQYLFQSYKKNGGTRFIAISKDTKIYFESTAKPHKVELLPNAIDYKKFYRQSRKDINQKIIKLISIGSLVDKKNHIFLIDVMAFLKKKGCLSTLEIVGEGKNKVEIQNKILESGLNAEITLKGHVDYIENRLELSNMYLHCATYEPFGLVLIEAMAAGLPVITLDGKGNRDLIEQGKNGYMIFEENAEIFADTILTLWKDKIKYQEMSMYAQQFAKRFDIKEYCEQLLVLYSI